MGFYQEHCVYLPAMLGWFFFSAVLSAYNKVVFGSENWAFPCPLLMTSVHFLFQWVFSYVLSSTCPYFWGANDVKQMSWRSFLAVSIPCGLVTSMDVGLSNMALVRITITFYTMVKASAPIFVLITAFCFGLEKMRMSLILVVLIISAGELLTVHGEVEFDGIGFSLCLGASILSGMRWTLVQLKIHQMDPPLKTAIVIMRILSPLMFLSMLVLSFAIEKPWEKLSPENSEYFSTAEDAAFTILMALTGAVLAVCMVLCEFWLIMKSSALILMVGGVFKELNTIILGVFYFGDRLNETNIIGCIIVFLGALLYKCIHHMEKMEEKANQGQLSIDYRPIRVAPHRNDSRYKPDMEESDAVQFQETLLTDISNDLSKNNGSFEEIPLKNHDNLEDSTDLELTDLDIESDQMTGIERLRHRLNHEEQGETTNDVKPIV